MSDRAPMQVLIYQCPDHQVRVALEVLDDYDLALADDELVLGQPYLAEEAPLGSSGTLADVLSSSVPGCSFLAWEDPALQWLGTTHAHVAGVGDLTADCDAHGNPVWTSRKVSEFVDSGMTRHELRERLGLTVLEAIDQLREALPTDGRAVRPPQQPERTWTVIGLCDVAANTFLVAGVVAGQHDCPDTDAHADEHGQWQRTAHQVQAPDADTAAYRVTQAIEDTANRDGETSALRDGASGRRW
jgi:hypothetical protein